MISDPSILQVETEIKIVEEKKRNVVPSSIFGASQSTNPRPIPTKRPAAVTKGKPKPISSLFNTTPAPKTEIVQNQNQPESEISQPELEKSQPEIIAPVKRKSAYN